MYFNSMPKIYYDSQNNKNPKVVTNLLRRVGVRAKIKTNIALFDTYRVKAGETPEIIAHKLYGDSELHWIVMLINNVTDRYHDWPIPQTSSLKIALLFLNHSLRQLAIDIAHKLLELFPLLRG